MQQPDHQETKAREITRDRDGENRTSAPAMPFAPRRVPLSEEIATYVRELIMSGQMGSHQPVNIDALARSLQTSATPVREALLLLTGEGFVQMEPRRGFAIARLTRGDVEDMFLAQSMVAGELAERAARVISQHLLDQITGLQEEMARDDASSQNREETEVLNFEFHRLINRAAESPKLSWLLTVVVRYVPRLFYSTIGGWHEASLRDHAAIIDALKEHDPEGARRAMAFHIRHAGELLATHLENQGFWSMEEERTS